MTSASKKPRAPQEQKWRRKGHEVVEAGRNGRRVLMAVSIYPDDYASLDLAASAPDMARDIQRLRSAMVHAMDDAEQLATWPGVGYRERAAIRKISAALKTALEKK